MNHVALKTEIECLRGHLNKLLDDFLQKYGVPAGAEAPKRLPRRGSKRSFEKDFEEMLATGKRPRKPEHLKRK